MVGCVELLGGGVMGSRLIRLGVPGGSASYAQYIKSTVAPLMWLKFNEASGNIVNYGNEGGVGTVTGCTQGQVGKFGGNQAYSFDGTDDIISIANAALPNLKAVTTQRWAFLVNASSLGELSRGVFFRWGAVSYLLQFQANNVLRAFVDLNTTDANVVTNDNQVDFLGSWAWVFMDYDDADTLGLGRKIRLFKGISNTVTQLTFATDTAGVGTVVSQTGALSIGNTADTSLTFAGLMDEAIAGAGLWTTAIMQRIVALSGV